MGLYNTIMEYVCSFVEGDVIRCGVGNSAMYAMIDTIESKFVSQGIAYDTLSSFAMASGNYGRFSCEVMHNGQWMKCLPMNTQQQ